MPVVKTSQQVNDLIGKEVLKEYQNKTLGDLCQALGVHPSECVFFGYNGISSNGIQLFEDTPLKGIKQMKVCLNEIGG